jgi:hypothetical protein
MMVMGGGIGDDRCTVQSLHSHHACHVISYRRQLIQRALAGLAVFFAPCFYLNFEFSNLSSYLGPAGCSTTYNTVL